MSIAPFEQTFSKDGPCAPEIQLLEIRPSDDPDARDPCAWVYVRREEKSVRDTGSKDIAEASITLSYQAVDARMGYATRAGGTFTASYSRAINRISLTGLSPHSRGGILIPGELRGLHLGTYLFNAIVGWAKQWPSAVVNSIGLSEVDAYPENRLRRNRFYEQFGLVFDYSDELCKGGRSRAMPAGNLQQVEAWEKNIAVFKVHEHLARVLQENRKLRFDLEGRERAIDALNETLRRQASRPVRTALSALWARHARWLLPMLVILGLVAGAYRRFGH